MRLDRQMRHNIEVVVDRLVAGPKLRPRLAEAVELALRLGNGNLVVAEEGREEGGEGRGRDKQIGRRGDKETGREAEIAPAILSESPSLRVSPSPLSPLPSPLVLSAHYACTHCGLSFEPPSPQLFSFNSPQGMCPECDGLGQIYTFDPERLISDPSRSFQQGCIELVGSWRDMGRWRRHIYRGVAETLERKDKLPPGTVLETAWEELDPALQHALLWGTGDEHITFTWRSGTAGHKWGGRYEGIIPKLLSQYRTTHSRMQRRQLEKYMCVLDCQQCRGARLNPQARAVTLASRVPAFADRPERSLPEVCAMAVSAGRGVFRRVGPRRDGPEDRRRRAQGNSRPAAIPRRTSGLEYLTLERTAPTLSGGEMQRIRLAGQIGCGLVGVLYILDEPSIGLHPRDNDRLLAIALPAPRPGQYGDRRRARRGHDAGGRPHRRFRTRAGRPRRARRRRRTAGQR